MTLMLLSVPSFLLCNLVVFSFVQIGNAQQLQEVTIVGNHFYYYYVKKINYTCSMLYLQGRSSNFD
jgi:hypothetical protein